MSLVRLETFADCGTSSTELTSRAVVNSLFGVMAGDDGTSMQKAACRIAAEIEEDLISKEWPSGSIYGSESSLVERYGACRVVVRESVRILESRGTARMRRGPNGGLLVQAPVCEHVLDAALRYADALPQTRWHGAAQPLFDKVCQTLDVARGNDSDRVNSHVVDFFRQLIKVVAAGISALDCANSPPRELPARSRAEQISRRLVLDLSNPAMQSARLGSEMDLCERYGADRNVLRQAVRVLEFEGLAVSVAGRGKGLMARIPNPAATCRLISCYFASKKVPTHDAMLLFKHVSAEAAALAAHKATDRDLKRLNAARISLQQDTYAKADSIHEAEESQFSIVADPLIDLILRSTKSYSTWYIGPNYHPNQLDHLYRLETLKVMQAILDRDPLAATAAQLRKFDVLARVC